MRRLPILAILVVVLLTVFTALPADARKSRRAQISTAAPSEQEILRDFEAILDLWRDGRYNELFERTALNRQSREEFGKTMASAPRRPTCCWDKMQDARVTVTNNRAAMVRARLGFDRSVPGTEYVTKGVKLKKEGDVWVISQSELYSLANLRKRQPRYKYLPIQPK
ncbi:hypothetical protein L4X63_20550 [Geomonas sp. Red32]|uniref:hypothetical protein n=1 Tax=Geomonas sp. Red32 TaxID=2912856 RepID=UPI00202CC5E2|nr:hypothetical protein [Geomonas sp. Red32]MCM0083976.1 hypothetical protein [Geomonas sp. Red32]